jgi:hypothetical protein
MGGFGERYLVEGHSQRAVTREFDLARATAAKPDKKGVIANLQSKRGEMR